MSKNRINTMGLLYSRAAECKARCDAMAAKVEPVHVEAADLLIRRAIAMHKEFGMSPSNALRTLIQASQLLRDQEKEEAADG